jgi:hypothetical protein
MAMMQAAFGAYRTVVSDSPESVRGAHADDQLINVNRHLPREHPPDATVDGEPVTRALTWRRVG